RFSRDWSSDVCSSDLWLSAAPRAQPRARHSRVKSVRHWHDWSLPRPPADGRSPSPESPAEPDNRRWWYPQRRCQEPEYALPNSSSPVGGQSRLPDYRRAITVDLSVLLAIFYALTYIISLMSR